MLSDTGEGEEGDEPNGGQQASSLTANSCSINVITDLLNFGRSLTALKHSCNWVGDAGRPGASGFPQPQNTGVVVSRRIGSLTVLLLFASLQDL